MKKIAIICHDFKKSGANLSLANWIKDINHNKYFIIVVLPRFDRKFYNLLRNCGVNKIIIAHYMVTVKKLYKRNFKEKVKDTIKKIYSLFFNKFFFNILKIKLKKEQVDIIHSNSFSITYGVELAMKLNIPHIWHIREFMEEDHKISHSKYKDIKKLCSYSYAIFISDIIAKKFISKYNFKNYTVIYNKIEYDSKYYKKRKFMEDNICNCIIVGTLQENKGQLDAIKAIEKINTIDKLKINLYICGTGPSEDKLKKYVEKHKINNIYFLGFRDDIEELRKKMDIAFMCSRMEALGRATIEAQYYENLIIGADCGCTPFLINNGITGYLYKKNDIKELSTIIINACSNRSETEKIINNAKQEAIANYSKSISNKIESIYEKV